MTFTMNEAYAIVQFIKAHGKEKISLSAAFKLNKISALLEPDMTLFQEKYSEIVSRYGKFDEEGNLTELTGDGSALQEELNALAAVQVEKPDIKLTLAELEGLNLTIDEVQALMPFVVD